MTDLPTTGGIARSPAKPAATARNIPGAVIAALILAVTAFGAWQSAVVTEHLARSAITATATERLKLYIGSVTSAFGKFEYLPDLVARYPRVQSLLADRTGQDDVNTFLQTLAERAGADVVYLLDMSGDTVASSNWQEPLSFVGRNYGFRPYFRDAAAGGQGRYFAVGATTGRAGFFYAEPVRIDGTIAGVAVVKIETDSLQNDWTATDETVLVTDADGIVLLSSRTDWRYRTLRPLSEDTRERVRAEQRFGSYELTQLDVDIPIPAGPVARIDDETHVAVSGAIPGLGWTLHYTAPLGPARDRALAVAALVMLAGAGLLVAALVIRDRRLRRTAAEERLLNRKLEAEIVERQRAEDDLRRAQADLVQSSKLAALGRMSAAIAHELNQPLAAMQTFVSGSRVYLERGQTTDAGANLDRLRDLATRMGKITGQLKTFARRGESGRENIDLAKSISDAMALLEGRVSESTAEIEISGTGTPVRLPGDSISIEQVIVNLVANALDAVSGRPDGRIDIDLCTSDSEAVLRVSDNGPGISPEAMDRLFEPFFTTKDIGDGLGLGLSISYGIITEMGGRVTASNVPDGGAEFVVRLPLESPRDTGS